MKECLRCKAQNPNKALFCCMCGGEEFISSCKDDVEKALQKIIKEELLNNHSLFRTTAFTTCDGFSYNKNDETFCFQRGFKHCYYLVLISSNATFTKVISWMKKFKKKNPEVIYQGKVFCDSSYSTVSIEVYLPLDNLFVDIGHLTLEYSNCKSFLSQLKKFLPLLDNPKTLNADVKVIVESRKEQLEDLKKALSLSKKIYKETQKKLLADTKSNEEEK